MYIISFILYARQRFRTFKKLEVFIIDERFVDMSNTIDNGFFKNSLLFNIIFRKEIEMKLHLSEGKKIQTGLMILFLLVGMFAVMTTAVAATNQPVNIDIENIADINADDSIINNTTDEDTTDEDMFANVGIETKIDVNSDDSTGASNVDVETKNNAGANIDGPKGTANIDMETKTDIDINIDDSPGISSVDIETKNNADANIDGSKGTANVDIETKTNVDINSDGSKRTSVILDEETKTNANVDSNGLITNIIVNVINKVNVLIQGKDTQEDTSVNVDIETKTNVDINSDDSKINYETKSNVDVTATSSKDMYTSVDVGTEASVDVNTEGSITNIIINIFNKVNVLVTPKNADSSSSNSGSGSRTGSAKIIDNRNNQGNAQENTPKKTVNTLVGDKQNQISSDELKSSGSSETDETGSIVVAILGGVSLVFASMGALIIYRKKK